MGVVRAVFRATVRRRWRGLLLLCLATTATFSFPLVTATGARRAATSWARLSTATNAPDGGLVVATEDVEAAVADLRARPDVAGVGAFSYMPAAPSNLAVDESGLYAGFGPGFGTSVYRSLIVEGRRPDDDEAGEITINRSLQELTGLQVGDRTDMLGPGIEQPAVVVGIHRNPLEIGPNGGSPTALGSAAFLAAWWPAVQEIPGAEFLRPLVAVRFDPGADALAELEEVAAGFPDAALIRPGDLDSDVTEGMRAETTAYVVLALASTLTSLLMVGLLVGRVVRTTAEDGPVLAALGSVGVQRWLAGAAPPAVALLGGIALAPIVAIVASPLVRTGFAREADPATGIWFDGGLLAAATVALAVGLLLVVALAGWRADAGRGGAAREVGRHSRLLAALARWPSALVGTQITSRRLARATVAAVALATAGLLAAVTWAASAQRLTSDFRLQGWAFDAFMERNAEANQDGSLAVSSDDLLARPEIAGLASYDRFTVTIGGTDVDVLALTPERGSLHPSLRRGRAPTGPGEVALGPGTIRRLDVSPGDTITVPGVDGDVDLTVVGEAVYPLIGNGGFGETASVNGETGTRLVEEPLESGFLVDLAPGADLADLEAVVGDAYNPSGPFSPPVVQRMRGAIGIDGALVAFFAVFAAVVLGFGVVAGAHRSARDYAVVRSLGFRSRQVLAAVGWHTGLTVVTGVAIGVPLGIALGRTVWTASVRRLGVLDAFTVPAGSLALAGLTMVAVAALVSVAAARQPARAVVATALRTE